MSLHLGFDMVAVERLTLGDVGSSHVGVSLFLGRMRSVSQHEDQSSMHLQS